MAERTMTCPNASSRPYRREKRALLPERRGPAKPHAAERRTPGNTANRRVYLGEAMNEDIQQEAQQRLFPKDEVAVTYALPPEPLTDTGSNPVWTDNKARFIMLY